MTIQDRLNRRWQKLCADIAVEALRQGAKAPFIFACESGLCILDGPPFDAPTQVGHSEAILFVLSKPPGSVIAFDAGGW